MQIYLTNLNRQHPSRLLMRERTNEILHVPKGQKDIGSAQSENLGA